MKRRHLAEIEEKKISIARRRHRHRHLRRHRRPRGRFRVGVTKPSFYLHHLFG